MVSEVEKSSPCIINHLVQPEPFKLREHAVGNLRNVKQRMELLLLATGPKGPFSLQYKATILLNTARQETIDVFNTVGPTVEIKNHRGLVHEDSRCTVSS